MAQARGAAGTQQPARLARFANLRLSRLDAVENLATLGEVLAPLRGQ